MLEILESASNTIFGGFLRNPRMRFNASLESNNMKSKQSSNNFGTLLDPDGMTAMSGSWQETFGAKTCMRPAYLSKKSARFSYENNSISFELILDTIHMSRCSAWNSSWRGLPKSAQQFPSGRSIIYDSWIL